MKSKAFVFTAALVALFALAAFTVARAQQTSPEPPNIPTTVCPCMQSGRMGPMVMARGMRGRMAAECPMMIPGARIQVKSIDNGVQIRITSSDSKTARRIQILAQMMQLRQELRNLQ